MTTTHLLFALPWVIIPSWLRAADHSKAVSKSKIEITLIENTGYGDIEPLGLTKNAAEKSSKQTAVERRDRRSRRIGTFQT